MSQSKNKITELHRKAAIEKSAKENMYRIAVESIRTYLRAIEKAGELIDKIHKEYTGNYIKSRSIDLLLLASHKNFICEELSRHISLREYLERRKYGKLFTLIVNRMFNESFRQRFIDKNKEVDQDFNVNTIHYKTIKSVWDTLSKDIQKFHIMADIISEQKTTEVVMLQKYNLQKDELLTIIQAIQRELKGIEAKPQLATNPIGEKENKLS
jgi:hypothetical protein